MKKIIFTLLVLALFIGGSLLYFKQTNILSSVENATTTPAISVTPSTLQTRAAPEGSKEYANAQYGLSLFYPTELVVTEYAESGRGHTISFDNADGREGFQIYVIPYQESQIKTSQIEEDTHGTATGTPQEIVIGGQHALLFSSSNPAYGPLREVWFIHNGKLFEITVYADLEKWLSSILATLTFI